jgi:hypothetical protein
MADFAQLLAALDRAADNADDADNSALGLYLGQRHRIATTVIESDPFALAVQSLMEHRTEWQGTAGGLLDLLTPERPPKGWPKTPQGVGGRLKRLIPALEQAGIHIEHGREGHGRTRQYLITRRSDEAWEVTSASSASSAGAENTANPFDEVRTSADDLGASTDSGCPQTDAETLGNSGPADNADVADDYLHTSSSDPFDSSTDGEPLSHDTEPEGQVFETDFV